MPVFERLSVLIIEDSAFFRGMLAEILRALKVGRIMAMEEGGAAITHLRSVGKNVAAAQALVPDLIICDYIMSPINGAMVLRWVRQSEDSPDRFIPFVMISGAADGDRVREVRDMGVTEFLAKPFSVKAVANHMISAIDAPRPFIYTRDYFGPDRRRQVRPYNDVDRRVATEKDLEVVYTGSRLRSVNANAKAFVFKLPNRLREKIAGIGGGPLVIDPSLLLQAEQQLERMEEDYSDWVRGSIRQLYEAHRSGSVMDPRNRITPIQTINRIAHDLRGQGSTFGYPLITIFGRSLYDCTLDISEASDQLFEFIRTHIDGINAVIREKIKGDGGTMGKDLITSLERARDRLMVTY
jgi:CheY-like chemotaxis protein